MAEYISAYEKASLRQGPRRVCFFGRQYLPLHAGRHGSIPRCSAHALGGGISAHAGRGNGRAAGTHHVGPRRVPLPPFKAVYVPADDLTDPSPATTFAPLGRHGGAVAAESPRWVFIPADRPAWISHQPPASDPLVVVRITTIRRRGRARPYCSATRSFRTSSRFSAWTSCPKRTSSRCTAARARFSGSCRKPFNVAKVFTGQGRQDRAPQGHHPRLQGHHRPANTITCRSRPFYMIGGHRRSGRKKPRPWLERDHGQHHSRRHRQPPKDRSSRARRAWCSCRVRKGELGIAAAVMRHWLTTLQGRRSPRAVGRAP